MSRRRHFRQRVWRLTRDLNCHNGGATLLSPGAPVYPSTRQPAVGTRSGSRYARGLTHYLIGFREPGSPRGANLRRLVLLARVGGRRRVKVSQTMPPLGPSHGETGNYQCKPGLIIPACRSVNAFAEKHTGIKPAC